jgi:hypothetical protein
MQHPAAHDVVVNMPMRASAGGLLLLLLPPLLLRMIARLQLPAGGKGEERRQLINGQVHRTAMAD